MAQDRINKPQGNTGGSKASSSSGSGLDAVLQRAASVTPKVRVVSGANEQYFDNIDGKTVGSVKKSLRDAFNIHDEANAMVAGKEVADDFILEGGMSVEFTKKAGVKG